MPFKLSSGRALRRTLRPSIFAFSTCVIISSLVAFSRKIRLSHRTRFPIKEILAFDEVGRSSNGDRFRAINGVGDLVNPDIPPIPGTTILSGSSASLSGPWILLVHNVTVNQPDQLYIYDSAMDRPRPLGTGAGVDGRGVVSPSGRLLAYTHAPLENRALYSLWIRDLNTGLSSQLTHVTPGAWDYAPTWSPDEKKVAFVRVDMALGRAQTSAKIVDLGSSETSCILPENEAALGVAFGRANDRVAILTTRGVEMLSFVSGTRNLIMPTSALGGWGWRLGGIAMSMFDDEKVVFAVFSRKSWRSELWCIPSDRIASPTSIYSIRDATIETPSFIQVDR